MHICWEEVVALIHFVDTALEVTAVSINDESVLNIGIAIFWLPDCVERFDVKRVNLTSLTWCHLVTTVLSHPLDNSMTIWVSKT